LAVSMAVSGLGWIYFIYFFSIGYGFGGIAVVTIVEKGGYGSGCAQPTQDIFDAYFFYQGEAYTGGQSGVLIQ
ncbi:MAG: hypothetical protein IKM39_05055, partial [Clostridia bacterium]|nr:hypothetical protein [Clostridia bacterium]